MASHEPRRLRQVRYRINLLLGFGPAVGPRGRHVSQVPALHVRACRISWLSSLCLRESLGLLCLCPLVVVVGVGLPGGLFLVRSSIRVSFQREWLGFVAVGLLVILFEVVVIMSPSGVRRRPDLFLSGLELHLLFVVASSHGLLFRPLLLREGFRQRLWLGGGFERFLGDLVVLG